jgi:hypothetical protein
MSIDRTRDKIAPGFGAVVAILTIAAGAAIAQAPRTPGAPDPKACAPGEQLERRDMRPETPVSPGETLSDKLARTDGVLCPPPGIDPEMSERPREGGALKVIPPPGSPGGNPHIRPK